MRNLHAIQRLGVLAASLVLAACATVESEVHVPYAAHGSLAAGAEVVPVTVTAVDARVMNRGRISTKKNGYGMDMAAIRSADDLAEVVKRALSQECAARGYRIGDGGAEIQAKITTFYNDYQPGVLTGRADAKVDLTIAVTREGRAAYTRDFEGLAQKTVEIYSGTNAAAALSEALGHAIDAMFADPNFVRALSGSPTAGG